MLTFELPHELLALIGAAPYMSALISGGSCDHPGRSGAAHRQSRGRDCRGTRPLIGSRPDD
jgi:hypothetical protein